MLQRHEAASAASKGSSSGEASSEKSSDGAETRTTVLFGNPRRSSFVWLGLLATAVGGKKQSVMTYYVLKVLGFGVR
ncbi:hypothetical protein RJT34_29526 [Clitoria ternatea]|uniref:Uncharacterized protein n=1 Tax=Clitoria ternatea TaxID=43366 RepID=A0AAN9FAK0_CLITE